MKKLTLLFLCSLFLLTSCQKSKDVPLGLWQSDDPNIILDFKPNYENPNEPINYYGSYVINGVENSIFVVFYYGNKFCIRNISDLDLINNVTTSNSEYFIGSFKVKKDKLYYTLTKYYQNIYGFKEIVFTKIKDYPPAMPTE